MTISTPFQVAKLRDSEIYAPMFPRGVHQMLAYCYALEGVPAHEWSAHAKLIDLHHLGLVEPFDVTGVNLSGLSTLEKRGEAAGIREQVEAVIGEDNIFRAKFAPIDLASTHRALVALALQMHDTLTTGRRRMERGKRYVADVCHLVVRPNYQRDTCTVFAVSKLHQVGLRLVYKDLVAIERECRRIEKRLLKIIEEKCKDLVKSACANGQNVVG